MSLPRFKTEVALWDHLATKMRGRWERLEAVLPSGMPDCFGFYKGETHWLELKIGTPAMSALRSEQVDFGSACGARGIPFWLCFGYRGRPLFFKGLNLDETVTPPWWIDAERGPRSSLARSRRTTSP